MREITGKYLGSKRNLAAVEPRNLARKQGFRTHTSFSMMKKRALSWDAETIHGSLTLSEAFMG